MAASTAQFGLPEPKRGLMPDFGGACQVARVLPANIARELLLTATNLSADRAATLGMVNRVTEPGTVLESALELAESICANAPLAVCEALNIANREINGDEDDIWTQSDAAHSRLLGSHDVVEGIGAFFERREPTWRGE